MMNNIVSAFLFQCYEPERFEEAICNTDFIKKGLISLIMFTYSMRSRKLHKIQSKLISALIFFSLANICGPKISAQLDTIPIRNASLEALPLAGTSNYNLFHLPEWNDCSPHIFPGESSPDIHPGNFFNVTKSAKDGKTYVGLVARENGTWEGISQKLDRPIEEGKCYSLELYLARSENYVNRHYKNGRKKSINFKKGQRTATIDGRTVLIITSPLVFRLYGGSSLCDGILLFETKLIKNIGWQKYVLNFQAPEEIEWLTFSVFYFSEDMPAYNGNLLIDNISPIIEMTCDLDK